VTVPEEPKPGKGEATARPRNKGWANLRPAAPGEVRNKDGINGRHRADYIAAFLDRADNTELGRRMIVNLGMPADTPRIDALIQRDVLAGLGPNENARRLLIEQYGGRAKQQVDVTSSDRSMSPNRKPTTAEARQELDAILSALDERAPAAAGAVLSETVEETEGAATAAPVEAAPAEIGGAAETPEVAAEADTEPKAEP